MDTAVVKIPFVSLASVGRPPDARSFQFNRLILGMITDSAPWPRYLHGELLHLTSLLYYPLIERMPFDSRLSKKLFFALKSALGVVTLFFPDRITTGNRQVLVDDRKRWDTVQLCYRESAEKEHYIRQSVSRMRSALWHLGCVPRGIARSPSGAGIHYAGTVPMGNGPKRCDAAGRSNLFPNLYIADGAAFPSLPSKSITMSLAAHATRVCANCRAVEERRPVSAVADRPAGIRCDLRLSGSHPQGAPLRSHLPATWPAPPFVSLAPADSPGSWPNRG